jgi:hypothetical protein
MQKRVLPFAFALRASSRTGSMSTSREALVDVAYLDDCEQYEPASKLEISRTCLSMTAYNLRSTLPLSYQVKGEPEYDEAGAVSYF